MLKTIAMTTKIMIVLSLYSIWTETTIATLLALAPNGSQQQKAVILPKVSLISANYLIMTIMMMMMMI